MGHEMFDMWDAMKRASYARVIEELETNLDEFEGDGDEIIKMCLDRVSRVLHTQASSFWVYHLNGDGLIRPHAFNGGVDISGVRLFPGEGIVGNVIATGEAVIIEDCQNDSRFAQRVDDSSGFNTKTMICVPTECNSMTYGCIQLINKEDDSLFDEQDLELAKNLSNKITELLSKKNVLEKYGFGTSDALLNSTSRGSICKSAIVFVDMVGFTELANTVDTFVLTNIVHKYMTYVTSIISKYNGYFDKIICDRIQSFWGGKEYNGNPVYNACKAALEIINGIDDFRKIIRSKYNIDIYLKVGVSYGETYMGNIGANQSLDYTIVWRQVSIAKFISVACKPDTVNVTEEVVNMLEDYDCDIRKADRIKVGRKSLDVYWLKELN